MLGASVGAFVGVSVGTGVGAMVGTSVGAIVSKQLVVLSGSVTKPSRHSHANPEVACAPKWEPASSCAHIVLVGSQLCDPPSHGCSVGLWVGVRVGAVVAVGSADGRAVGEDVAMQLVVLNSLVTYPSMHAHS